MVAQNIFFGVVAAVVAVSAVLVVTTRNVVHAALYLVAVLAGIGVNFLLLGAEFVGVTQVLVYIGAIVVLFLFGIMLTRAPLGGDARLTGKTWPSGLLVATALAALLGYTLIDAFGDEEVPTETRQLTADVSDTIFGPYLIAFEVASVLLLAALVGAIVLARRD
jgi:NADH-quinone oxidoreductase subunit J